MVSHAHITQSTFQDFCLKILLHAKKRDFCKLIRVVMVEIINRDS